MEEGVEKLPGKEERGGVVAGVGLDNFKKYRRDFALRLEGYLHPPSTGDYVFELASNKVGILSINGEVLVSLGEAGRERKTFRREAKPQKLELMYLLVDGSPELELLMSGPGLKKGPVPPTLLSSEKTPVLPLERFVVDEEKARQGKGFYGQFLCGRCHGGGTDVQTKEFADLSRLDPAKGCLSVNGNGLSFALSSAQREDIRAALAAPDYKPAAEEKIHLELARFNCIGWHERGTLGGVRKDRNDYFTSADPKLGEPGRLPPPAIQAVKPCG